MDLYRLKHTLRLCTILGSGKRAQYLKEKKVFHGIGEHCFYMPRRVPLYPNLIKLGDYVNIASNVSFYTHDGVSLIVGDDRSFLPERLKDYQYKENIGCIEIGNHVFISANCQIGNNVKIGDHVIITAGSVVSSDIPSNSVARGNPAKVICSFSQYMTMLAIRKYYPDNMNHKTGKYVGKELEEWLWNDFNKTREKS